jgi:hypothetical protein
MQADGTSILRNTHATANSQRVLLYIHGLTAPIDSVTEVLGKGICLGPRTMRAFITGMEFNGRTELFGGILMRTGMENGMRGELETAQFFLSCHT